MSKFSRLFIAEKPSLAQGIADALADLSGSPARKGDGTWEVGNDRVSWLFGHMYETAEPGDMDPKWARWTLDSLPIVVAENAWKMEPLKKHVGHLSKIKALVRGAQLIVHCGDAAREGQLLVDEVIIGSGADSFAPNVHRLWVKSMAKKDMIAAVQGMKPNLERRSLYDSALCRQRADYQHGLTWTRFMTVKAKHSGYDVVLSVGRVQTPTLRLVVDRDREREAFKPVDHFTPKLVFVHSRGEFSATWVAPTDHEGLDHEGRLTDLQVANKIIAKVQGKEGLVSAFKEETKHQPPPLPFSLSALQAACSAKFQMTAEETLETAQALYETHKVTTYPRSDSRHLPSAIFKDEAPSILKAISNVPDLAEASKAIDFSLKSAAWDDSKVSDHHAIIPTTEFSAAKLARMSERERAVCLLIVRSFLMQFLPLFKWRSITADITCEGYDFKAKGRVILDLGWRRVYVAGEGEEDENDDQEAQQALPPMQRGDKVRAKSGEAVAKRTTPPSAFTDGTLITAMANIHRFVSDPEAKKKLRENAGIGTEATRASIISTLLGRGFLKRKGKTGLISAELGRSLIDALPADLKDPVLTARWESALEDVEKSRRSWQEFMKVQATYLHDSVRRHMADQIVIRGVKAKVEPAEGSGTACPKCQEGTLVTFVVKKEGPSKGKPYLSCSRNPACDHRQWPKETIAPIAGHGRPCTACGTGTMLTRKFVKDGKESFFLSCSNYPTCKPAERPAVIPLEGHGAKCTKCAKGVMRTLVVRKDGPNQGKRFLGCSEAGCKNMVWPEEAKPARRA